jgi:hypothetical protein
MVMCVLAWVLHNNCLLRALAVQVVAELAPEEGLVLPAAVPGAAVSGLVLLLQALQLKGLLNPQQEQLLRLLAWQHDTKVMRVWDTVSMAGSRQHTSIDMMGARITKCDSLSGLQQAQATEAARSAKAAGTVKTNNGISRNTAVDCVTRASLS